MSRSVVRVDASHLSKPLLVEIRKDGSFVRMIELADPREAFCGFWNARNSDEGLTAHPVSRATLIAKSVR